MNDPAFIQTIQFIVELDKLKSVLRRSQLISQDRHENSAEHSWHATMLALTLAASADKAIDINKVIKLLMVHDIGEIGVGDKSLYACHDEGEGKNHERRAAQAIFGLLPAHLEKELQALWDEFAQNETAEAHFANAMDRLIPAILDLHSHGKGWKTDRISRQQVQEKVVPKVHKGCSQAARWLEQELDRAARHGYFSDSNSD